LTDKEKTKKFNTLVDNAEKLINNLPWPLDFERDTFASPDFTALDVVCFASDGCPIGINIPNYQDIKENEGFKNISISNAYPSYKPENLIFCSEKDIEMLKQIGKQAYVMHVACHELLGHGSGKLLKQHENGEFNFDIENLIHPITNGKVDKLYAYFKSNFSYLHNETFESKFTDIGRSFEECRADLAGLYFCFFKEIHLIFECDEGLYKELVYAIWLLYIRKAIIGLSLYNDEVKKWGQAHTQGAWVFVQYLLENQISGQEILTVQFEEEQKQFHINLNK
jgi:dipeptidyl-peptidase-3